MFKHTHYDVIVAGAGPAGVAFARTALRHAPQLKIAVVDKAKFPRDKICGDGLTFLTIPLLAQIFPDLDLRPFASPSSKVSVRAPFGSRWYQFDQNVDVIPRRILDHELVKTLAVDGIELLEEATVVDLRRDAAGVVNGLKIRKSGNIKEISCELLVGADGSAGVVRRKTGSIKGDDTIFAIRQYCRAVPPTRDGMVFDLHVEDDFGYFWFFPFEKDGERWGNIGYGSFSRSLSDLRKRYEFYLQRQDIAPYLAGAEMVGKPEAFPINLARLKAHRLAPSRRSFGEGYVLIGDAAAIVHPYTGEGISFALESGKLAAEAYFGGADARTGAGQTYEIALQTRLKPTHQVLAAYALLRLPSKLPRPWVRPYLDGTIGAIRALRRIHPRLLNKDIFSKPLELNSSSLTGALGLRG